MSLSVAGAAVRLRDAGLALAVMVLLIVGSDLALPEELWSRWPGIAPGLPPDTAGLLLIAAGSLPLAFRRAMPVPVFVVCVVASLAEQVRDGPTPLPLGVLVALYSVAVLGRPAVAAAATGGYLVALGICAFAGWVRLTDDLFYTYVLAVAATVLLGYGVALVEARTRLVEQQANELVREQDMRTRAAVEQEQARIAREVHDIVAHHLSVIVAQAAAAGLVIDTQPRTVGAALAAIEDSGRDALHGLRRLVGMLRTAPAETDQRPQPGLDRLPWLLAQVRQAGLPVSLAVHGEATPLSATVELNAFRIIQESLTNALKHAGPAKASVSLDYSSDCLGIEVLDAAEGKGPLADQPPPGEQPGSSPRREPEREPSRAPNGYGLISMKQRAALLGGDLVAERIDGCGFRIAARLPLTGSHP